MSFLLTLPAFLDTIYYTSDRQKDKGQNDEFAHQMMVICPDFTQMGEIDRSQTRRRALY
ncbi:MAG: hypothetical protein ACI4PC_09580 [Oscillospiraceae bacterium]